MHGGDEGKGGKGRTEGVGYWEEVVSKGDDEERQSGDGVEDEEKVPVPDDEVGVEEGDAGGEERGNTDVDGEADGSVTFRPCPSGDEGEEI